MPLFCSPLGPIREALSPIYIYSIKTLKLIILLWSQPIGLTKRGSRSLRIWGPAPGEINLMVKSWVPGVCPFSKFFTLYFPNSQFFGAHPLFLFFGGPILGSKKGLGALLAGLQGKWCPLF